MEKLNVKGLMVNGVNIFHNAKKYTYPNGFTKLKVASKPIYRESGYEVSFGNAEKERESKPQVKGNEPRTDSIRRAKQKIFDIVMLNDFDYFVTLTFSSSEVDRTNADEILKKTMNFLKNRVQRQNLKYILIPEYHKDGAIHIHALMKGDIKLVDSGTRKVKGYKKPLRISTIEKRNISPEDCQIVYNISDWTYGHSTAIKIYGECENFAKYITKYITKDVKKIFGKFYLSGGSLVRNPQQAVFDIDYDSIEAKEYLCEATGTKFKYLDYKEERNDKK